MKEKDVKAIDAAQLFGTHGVNKYREKRSRVGSAKCPNFLFDPVERCFSKPKQHYVST